MKRSLLVLVVIVGVLTVGSGVALAATIQCPNRTDGGCWGTPEDDTITGTPQPDQVRARNGDDVIRVAGDEDFSIGGGGVDSVYGQAGPDQVIGGNVTGLNSDDESKLFFTDNKDDVVRGGISDDETVAGGYGKGGQDRLYGGKGDDTMYSAQEGFPFGGDVQINKEIVDCGPGEDTSYYDPGVDVVEDNCETQIPGFPDIGERSGSGAGRLFGGATR